MPCTARIFQKGSCYYIKSRSLKKERMFNSDDDYDKYIRLLNKYKVRFGIFIYGFCLMPCSVRLVLHPKTFRDISFFMQGVNQSYTIYFNREYKRRGRLWWGRFESRSIDRARSLFDGIKHLEMLPVREQLSDSPVEYPWSSCIHRVLGDKAGILDRLLFDNEEFISPIGETFFKYDLIGSGR